MKIVGFSVLLVAAFLAHCAVSEDEVKYDLTDKNQFSFYFRQQWELLFGQPMPVAMQAKAAILALVSEPLYMQPCFMVARQNGYSLFDNRLWAMHHALQSCTVNSVEVLPMDPNDNTIDAPLHMEFVQNSSYVSYTHRFSDISLHIKAKKEEVDKPFRIYNIYESCSLD
ncbi:unnamed protein product [Caenorhabditis sp. 36 PRJEB53466]|nr:unnamed protein product [Caenorhabditis sp. 36 PRJEB53466]